MRTVLLVLALLACPSVASAQTVGDVVQLAISIETEQGKCAEDNNPCRMPFIRLGDRAITLGADALKPSSDPCIAKMKKDPRDSSCAAAGQKRWQQIRLSDAHAEAYRTLKRTLDDELDKRRRNFLRK